MKDYNRDERKALLNAAMALARGIDDNETRELAVLITGVTMALEHFSNRLLRIEKLLGIDTDEYKEDHP